MALRFLSIILLLVADAALAQSISTQDLRRHIEVLAADDFLGRAPGTAGETKTLAYLQQQFTAAGLVPAGEGGGWLQPVPLVKRSPVSHAARWRARGRDVTLAPGELVLVGSSETQRLSKARAVFAGHGAVIPGRGIDQFAGADLQGRIVFLIFDAPAIPGFPSFAERAAEAVRRGAAGVIAIVGEDTGMSVVTRALRAARYRRLDEPVAPVSGAVSLNAMARLVAASGGDFARLLDSAPGPAFRAVRLGFRGTLDVTTRLERLDTNNFAAILTGSDGAAGSVLILGHWDHVGLCGPEGAADRICNGAVDNASGIASMIEVARRLAAGPRPRRSILFLATTAEEMGLLGAEHFAQHPLVPAESIVVALNLDTVAIHKRGTKVAVIGRGMRALDAAIAASVAEQGRAIDDDGEADSFITRQDGWALRRTGIPTVMVGGSFSDMALLRSFLAGPYHAPDDEAGPTLELGGAAEDADLLVLLARRLGEPALYQKPAAPPEDAQ